MPVSETGPGPFEGPPRPETRIDDLLSLLAEDWKKSGSDQRFFQYILNLQSRLGLPTDAFFLEDDTLIRMLKETARPE